MKRLIHLFIIFTFLGLTVGDAGAETMEERKQRIMRKYLREHQTVVQSDMVLPEIEEDERVSDSRRFSQVDVDLGSRKDALPPPAQMARQVVPVQAPQNWLLDEDEGVDADPYADPFALKKSEDERESAAEWWSQWRSRQEAKAAEREADATQQIWFDRDSGSIYGGQSRGSDRSPYGQGNYLQPGTPYGNGRELDAGSRSYYGSSPQSPSRLQPGVRPGAYGTTRYGSSPSSGMLQWTTPSQDRDTTPSDTGYTPYYRSPYQNRQEQRRQQQPGYTQPQQQEFTRPTPYQKWKNDNQGWDPTADDAYLDSLMQPNRR